jgi:hypothetical protein
MTEQGMIRHHAQYTLESHLPLMEKQEGEIIA